MCQQTKLCLRKRDQTAVLLCVTNVPASNSRSYISQQISADLMTNHVSLLKHLLQPPPFPYHPLAFKSCNFTKVIFRVWHCQFWYHHQHHACPDQFYGLKIVLKPKTATCLRNQSSAVIDHFKSSFCAVILPQGRVMVVVVIHKKCITYLTKI